MRRINVDLVIHGGDVFFRSKVSNKIADKAYDAIFSLAEEGFPIVIVPGNHDRSILPSSLFLQHPNISVFWEPGVFTLYLRDQMLHVAGFPFIRQIGNEISDIVHPLAKAIPKNELAILCMHQTIEGARVGPSDYVFRKGPEVVSISELDSSFAAYLSGHIHRHQILWKQEPDIDQSQIPIIYPGSIERTSFAERNEEKGFVVLTLEESSVKSIDFIPLPTRSMHVITTQGKSCNTSLTIWVLDEIQRLPERAQVRIDIASQEMAKMLTLKKLKKHSRDDIIIQLRQQWLTL